MEEKEKKETVSVSEAYRRLKEGNEIYLDSRTAAGDFSPELRKTTAEKGQHPYAVIITCSDSRVVPESIFSAGLGELFVIRTAGNTIGDSQLGSIEYAVSHLGVNLVVVLGHTQCGAVGAAMGDNPTGFIKYITDEIKQAIGNEKDDYTASCLNVQYSAKKIKDTLHFSPVKNETAEGTGLIGAVYHLETGRVEFL